MAKKRPVPKQKRRPNGTFAKGVSGNPSGRPRIPGPLPTGHPAQAAQPGPLPDSLSDFAAIVRYYSDGKLRTIARRLVRDATAGDKWAIEQTLRLREVSGQGNGASGNQEIDFSLLSVDELRILKALLAKGQGRVDSFWENYIVAVEPKFTYAVEAKLDPPAEITAPEPPATDKTLPQDSPGASLAEPVEGKVPAESPGRVQDKLEAEPEPQPRKVIPFAPTHHLAEDGSGFRSRGRRPPVRGFSDYPGA